MDLTIRFRTFKKTRPEYAVAGTAVRKYVTTFVWYEDRLCALSSGWLVAVALLCLGALTGLGTYVPGFLDDLVLLVPENDLRPALITLELLLVTSAILWVLACTLAALARRCLLAIRGL